MVDPQETEPQLSIAGSAAIPDIHPDVTASGVTVNHEQITAKQTLGSAQEQGAPVFPANDAVPVLTKPEKIATTDPNATPAWEKIWIQREQEEENAA